MNKNIVLGMIAVLTCIFLLASCSSTSKNEESSVELKNSTMKYIDKKELKYAITSVQKEYVLLDVRKKEDYDKGHIINALSADVDETKTDSSKKDISIPNIKKALKTATGSEVGNKDSKIILLCYSGEGYAQIATDLLISIGVDANNIYTLKEGYKGWTSNDPNGEYQFLIDAVAKSKEVGKENEFTSKLFKEKREGDLYFTPEEVKNFFDSEKSGTDDEKISDYYIMDARFETEYEDGHLISSVHSATFGAADGAVWVPREQAVNNVKEAFSKKPYEKGQKIIVVCRGGRGGAQLLDDILKEDFDIKDDLIYTLSYGFTAFDNSWSKQGEDYMQYTIKGKEIGELK